MECDSGMQDAADATMEVAKTLNEKISKYCLVTIETCAYAGTGNVLKVSITSSSFFVIYAKCCGTFMDFTTVDLGNLSVLLIVPAHMHISGDHTCILHFANVM
jgi:hypothetical protein